MTDEVYEGKEMAQKRCYVRLPNGREIGPMSARELRRLVTEGQVTPDTLVKVDEGAQWIPAGRIKGLEGQFVDPAVNSESIDLDPPGRHPRTSINKAGGSTAKWIVIGVLGVAGITCSGCCVLPMILGHFTPTASPLPTSTPDDETEYSDSDSPMQSRLSLTNFNSLTTGVSDIADATAAFGSDYEVISENTLGAGTQFEVSTKMLQWREFLVTVHLMFQKRPGEDWTLVQKSQFGLE